MFGSYLSKLTPTLLKFGYNFVNSQERTTFNTQQIWYITLTLRLLMSYIYGAPILDVSRSHTTTQHSR